MAKPYDKRCFGLVGSWVKINTHTDNNQAPGRRLLRYWSLVRADMTTSKIKPLRKSSGALAKNIPIGGG